MRKSARVLIPEADRRYTLPPLPPSPPSGPPNGTNFSRRKLVLPRPPLPAYTRTRASSTNFTLQLYFTGPGPDPGAVGWRGPGRQENEHWRARPAVETAGPWNGSRGAARAAAAS